MKSLRPYQAQAVKECWDALKANDDPVLLMASVGAGKSLMLADILLTLQKNNKVALCLVNNAELVRNNCQTFTEQGGKASIYCAALNSKDVSQTVIFGTPQSILNGIVKKEVIAYIRFNLILVDEAHAINYLNSRTGFMRILRHYKQSYPDMRLLGTTGTNFRFKGTDIVGPKCLFKTQVGNITTDKLIKDGYLIEPKFEIDPDLVIDFSQVKIKQNGLFDQKQLQEVVEQNTRLTKLICQQIVYVMEQQKRFGVFIFATTKKHAQEILSYLPPLESAIILGETPQDERSKILDSARVGKIKYLVNIAIISVGVDVPAYDTIAYLRPTESLVLLVQTMGRALRLSPHTNKSNALILDFAGNIERHRDWDNPILLKAVAQSVDDNKPLVIECPRCQKLNTENARRCVGVINDVRCDYYFQFKECPNTQCNIKNDISARHCRACETEIIDPNAKLNLHRIVNAVNEVDVIRAKYGLSGNDEKFTVHCAYFCKQSNGSLVTLYENFTPCSEKARYVFYGQFVRKHCNKSSAWFMFLDKKDKVQKMLDEAKTPLKLQINMADNNKIKKKIF